MEGQTAYSTSAHACTLDPSPQSCLQLPCSSVHMAEVLTQKQCHEPVRREDLRGSRSSGNSLYVLFTVRLF